MKRRLGFIVCLLLLLPLVAQEVREEGMFVSASGYSETGRFVHIDELAPNSGGVVSSSDGVISISLNEVFAILGEGQVLEPINIDEVQVSLNRLPSGELYIELDEGDWELIFSNIVGGNEWSAVNANTVFQQDGKGWRIAKDKIPDPLFLRARLR